MIIIKKILFTQLLFCLPLFVVAQISTSGKFVLKGTINGNAPKKISIGYIDSLGYKHPDSTEIIDGKFMFRGTINGPTEAYLIGKVTTKLFTDPNITTVYLEPGVLEINLTVDDFQSAKLKGSATQNDYQKLNLTERVLLVERMLIDRAIDSVKKRISSQGNSKDLQDQMKILDDRWAKYLNSVNETRYKFIRENSKSAVSASLMPRMINNNIIPLDTAEMIYDKLPTVVKNSAIGVELKANIAGKRKLMTGVLGKHAPLLNGIDIDGQPLRSEDYIGKKYLLLDFWASWCVPCHEDFSFLKDLYNKYGKSGLEIIGVSADKNKVVWKKDIIRSGIQKWRHMLSEDDSSNSIGKQINDRFSIQAYPTLLLIDKSGVMIYRTDGHNIEDLKKLGTLLHSVISN